MTVTPVILQFYMCPQIFITIGPIAKKKIRSTVMTISHDDAMSAEKFALLKCINFTTSDASKTALS